MFYIILVILIEFFFCPQTIKFFQSCQITFEQRRMVLRFAWDNYIYDVLRRINQAHVHN